MERMLSALPLLLAGAAHALDISGVVQDKFENALAGAKLCLQGTTQCVETDALGKFRINGVTALGPVNPAAVKASLSFLGGRAMLNSPVAAPARITWFDNRGMQLGALADVRLAVGGNALALPEAARRGICFVRVSTPAFALTWKLALTGGSGRATAAALPAAVKTSAQAAGLDVSKANYQPAVYTPAQETETGVVIEIRPVGDKVLWDGKTFAGWTDKSGGAWKIVNGVIQQTNGGGVLHTNDNYGSFRFIFSSRMLAGSDHNPNVLLWCQPGSTDKRTMGGIQFQPPLGHMWDYARNEDPNKKTMTRVGSTAGLTPNAWNMCEALANQATATIRFACCMLGAKKTCDAAEIVVFKDPTYARKGPIALMIHDDKQKQEYKDLEIEVDPLEPDRLLSVPK